MKTIGDRLFDQVCAALAQMPEWARSGPVYVRQDGSPAGLPAAAGWPMAADLSRRPVDGNGRINSRPGPDDLRAEFWQASARGEAGARAEIDARWPRSPNACVSRRRKPIGPA